MTSERPPMTGSMARIDHAKDAPSRRNEPRFAMRYLLALNAGATLAPDGKLYSNRSWRHDLVEHTRHLSRLTFLAPVSRRAPATDEVELPAVFHRVVPYEGFGGRYRSYLHIPRFIILFVRELRRADVVHTCIAGKPYPIGWLIVPLARLLGVRIAIVVESAFWRISAGETPTLARKASARIWETLNRWCLRQADYAAYQHDQDRQALPAPRAVKSVLYQASWINEADIVPGEFVEQRLRIAASSPQLKVLFASRMVREKGTEIVAQLCALLRGKPIELTIIGEGPERDALATAASESSLNGQYVVARPIAYGEQFMTFLGQFDVVLVPSLSDEQPRIVYDAYAQGLPVVATRTSGLEACVTDGETGVLVAPADASALASALTMLAFDHDQLRALSFGALARAPLCTHRGFHAARARDLADVVGGAHRPVSSSENL